MNPLKEELTIATAARAAAVTKLATLATLFANMDVSTPAKIQTARAIGHLAAAAETLTKLRRELKNAGDTQ